MNDKLKHQKLIAKEVKAAMKEQGITQNQLYLKLDGEVGLTTINHFFNCRHETSGHKVELIKKAVGIK